MTGPLASIAAISRTPTDTYGRSCTTRPSRTSDPAQLGACRSTGFGQNQDGDDAAADALGVGVVAGVDPSGPSPDGLPLVVERLAGGRAGAPIPIDHLRRGISPKVVVPPRRPR